MHHNKTNKTRRVNEEDGICIAFVEFLTKIQNISQVPFIFFHVPNEISHNSNPIFGQKLKRMGKLNGTPDYCFYWENGCGFIEFKSKKGVLSPAQKSFKTNCEELKIPYEVCRSVEDGMNVLKNWGLLKNITF